MVRTHKEKNCIKTVPNKRNIIKLMLGFPVVEGAVFEGSYKDTHAISKQTDTFLQCTSLSV